MAKFCSLFSSSSGNCTYVGSSHGGILIDVGVSAKRVECALADIGVDPCTIEGIFITHEHSDHVKGIKVFAARHGIKVWASAGTLAGMEEQDALSPKIQTMVIPDSGTEAAGIYIRPFRTPHDSRESTGYSMVTPDGKRIAIATDIGKMTDTVMDAIHGSDLVLLESNHDVGMLQNGPYPFFLKQRILSDHGHLSNGSCALELPALINSGTTRIILGHLSRKNNLPEIARSTANAEIVKHGLREGEDYILYVAPPEGGMMFSL